MEVSELKDLITRKRRILGLEEGQELENFGSDLRHLAFSIFFCDQYEAESGEGPRFINLEVLDPDDAKITQRQKEQEWGVDEEGLTDVIDTSLKRKIEFTFTSGSKEIALARKRAKQRSSVIVVVGEDLDSYTTTDKTYSVMVEEAMSSLRGFMVVNGIPYRLNQSNAIKKIEPLERPDMSQIRRNLKRELEMDTRDPEEVLAKVAKQRYTITSSGGRRTRRTNERGEYDVWLPPNMYEKESWQHPDKSFIEVMKGFLEDVSRARGNGNPIEAKLVSWINERKIETGNGDISFVDNEKHGSLGEGTKKAHKTYLEAKQEGDIFFLANEERSRRQARGLSPKWSQMRQYLMHELNKEQAAAFLEARYQETRALGAVLASLHRKTNKRLIRPWTEGGNMVGFCFKGSSTAVDLDKPQHVFLVVFSPHPEGKECWFEMKSGRKIPFYVWRIDSKDSWTTPMIVAQQEQLWESEANLQEDEEVKIFDTVNVKATTTLGWKAVAWHRYMHLDEVYKSSAVKEAASAMARKLGACCEAKVDGRPWGAPGGFGPMCDEVDELVSGATTGGDFCWLNVCHMLSVFLFEQ